MIIVNNLYPNQKDGQFDMDYYLRVHIPMAKKIFGNKMKSVTIETGLNAGRPNSVSRYAVITRMTFDSLEAFYAAITPHRDTLLADVPKYTNITPVIQISEVFA